jgi:hypothetical protein
VHNSEVLQGPIHKFSGPKFNYFLINVDGGLICDKFRGSFTKAHDRRDTFASGCSINKRGPILDLVYNESVCNRGRRIADGCLGFKTRLDYTVYARSKSNAPD